MPLKIRQGILIKMILLDSKIPFQYTAVTYKRRLCSRALVKEDNQDSDVKLGCNFKMAHYYKIQQKVLEKNRSELIYEHIDVS
jgi:hypothetical protein